VLPFTFKFADSPHGGPCVVKDNR